MHNPESILLKETHKSISDFHIQTDYLILAIRPNLVIIKMKIKERNVQVVDFAVPIDLKVKFKES